jgi:hypothetical protein
LKNRKILYHLTKNYGADFSDFFCHSLVYAFTHQRYREALRSWITMLIGQRVDKSRTSFRSQRSHNSAVTRLSQKRVHCFMKCSATSEMVQMHSRCPKMTTAAIQKIRSKMFPSHSV